MDIFEFTHIDNQELESLFDAMKEILVEDLLSDENISTLVFCEFYEAGIDLKNYSNSFNKDEMLNFINLEITTNDINLEKLIDNLFYYSCIDSNEYELLREEFVINIENQASLLINVKQSKNKINECLIIYNNPILEYTLELSFHQLIANINNKINESIKNEYNKLTTEYIYAFREFTLSYDIDLLYENIKQKGDIGNA